MILASEFVSVISTSTKGSVERVLNFFPVGGQTFDQTVSVDRMRDELFDAISGYLPVQFFELVCVPAEIGKQ